MTIRLRPRSLTGLIFGLGVLVSDAGTTAMGSPLTVRLLAPRTSRLAEELRREMTASGFSTVVIESSTADWRMDARRLVGADPIHGVVVRADDKLMTVFTRSVVADSIQTHLEQLVEPDDRMARRRACLSVVEYLRVLSESDPPPPLDLGSPTTVPPHVQPAATGRPARIAPAAGSPASPQAPAPATSQAPAGQSPRASEAASGSAAPAISGPRAGTIGTMEAGLQPRQNPPGALVPEPKNGEAAAAGWLPPSETRETPFPPPEVRAWEVGAGLTLELEAAPGGPTSHLQFLWYLPLEWRLAICVRAFWPILGGQFRTDGNDVRAWAFGGAIAMQYLFKMDPGRLRPFVGTALGTRVALTETTPATALQSRETFTPSLTMGADAGVRYTLSPLVRLLLEVGVVHGWLVPGVHRATYEEQAANSDSIHASFGVVFEI